MERRAKRPAGIYHPMCQATTSTQKSKYRGFPSPGSRQIQTGRFNPPGMKIFILFLIYTSCQLCIEPTLYAVPRSPPEGHSSGPRSPALLPEPKPNYFSLSCRKKRRIFLKKINKGRKKILQAAKIGKKLQALRRVTVCRALPSLIVTIKQLLHMKTESVGKLSLLSNETGKG